MTKLAEGQYNKDFRLVMNDGKVVIARLPNPNAGPSFYATASEVATMDFARTVLEIPVPKVYEWSATACCPVGAEYIIMEEAPGVRLVEVWDELDPDSKLALMRELVSIETKLLSMSFHSYGSVYFASDMVKGSVPAKLCTDVSPGVKSKVSTQFTIGPLADRKFWNKERSEMDIDRGPWTTSLDYLVAIGRREIAWIDKYAVPKVPNDPEIQSTAQNSPSAHIALLEKFLKVVPHLLDVDDRLTSSNLWHTGLYSSNVSISQNRITSVTDWQGVWAGPLLPQAQPPGLLEYQGDVMLEYQDKVIVKRPQNFEDLADDEKAQIEQQISKSMLFQIYLVETMTRNPRLAEVFHLGYGKLRRFPVIFAGNTWDGDNFRDILPFREALINVERYWKGLGFSGECPIHFSEDELRSHLEDAEGWNDVQDFFDSIQDLVKRDGWTHNETYDAALDLFSGLRQEALQGMKGKEREEFEKETRWAEKAAPGASKGLEEVEAKPKSLSKTIQLQ